MKIMKIHIKSSSCDDITILDGDMLAVINGTYSLQDGVLAIETTDDLELIVPKGHYDLINISTDTGDCLIKLEESDVDKVVFNSNVGDLDVDANVKELSFNSPCGDCINRSRSASANPPVLSKHTEKTISPTVQKELDGWSDGERY